MDSGTIALISFGGIIALIIIWSVGVSIYNKSRGTISIVLDKYQFMRGDKVTGKVVVNLKKVIHAQKITVSLNASKEIMERNINPQSAVNNMNNVQMMQNQNRNQTETIFQFEMPLDGEKDYLQAEYPFEITIPQDAAATGSSNLSSGGAMIGGAVIGGAMNRLNPNAPIEMINSRVMWNVRAQLYIPGKLDLSGAVQINVA